MLSTRCPRFQSSGVTKCPETCFGTFPSASGQTKWQVNNSGSNLILQFKKLVRNMYLLILILEKILYLKVNENILKISLEL